jgi:hypothetical protein
VVMRYVNKLSLERGDLYKIRMLTSFYTRRLMQ